MTDQIGIVSTNAISGLAPPNPVDGLAMKPYEFRTVAIIWLCGESKGSEFVLLSLPADMNIP
jgi:hypothetical protein